MQENSRRRWWRTAYAKSTTAAFDRAVPHRQNENARCAEERSNAIIVVRANSVPMTMNVS
jgi:hypothetical protein